MSKTDAQSMARLFVGLGYPRAEIEQLLREDFPDKDVNALIDEAQAAKATEEGRIDRVIADEERRAREAEMDVDKTMHDES